MKVNLLSDVHLEFQRGKHFHPGEGDVLVLAGDICVAADLGTGSEDDEVAQAFFAECVKNYNKVYYTAGNHEYYHGDIENVDSILKKIPGVTYLNNSSECYQGWHFVGTTLWADFKNGNPVVMQDAAQNMTDYHVITKRGMPLTPMDTLKRHDEAIGWLRQCLPMLRGPIFMFSHHAPSMQSNQNYREPAVSGAYCTNLIELIESFPAIRYWAHGHVHKSSNYHIGNCNVIANPRGYFHYAINEDFNPTKQLLLDKAPPLNSL